MKPICPACQRFFRPKKNGLAFIEGMPNRNGAPAGNVEPDAWRPYKLWLGDLWSCHGCGAEIIVGTAFNPLAEHYQSDFASEVERLGATLQINDR